MANGRMDGFVVIVIVLDLVVIPSMKITTVTVGVLCAAAMSAFFLLAAKRVVKIG